MYKHVNRTNEQAGASNAICFLLSGHHGIFSGWHFKKILVLSTCPSGMWGTILFFFLEQLLAFFHTITNARNGNYSPRQEENIRRRWKAARCGDKPVIFGDEVNSDPVLNTQSRSLSGNFFLFLCRSLTVLSWYSHTWWAAFIEVLVPIKELICTVLLWNTRLKDQQNIFKSNVFDLILFRSVSSYFYVFCVQVRV